MVAIALQLFGLVLIFSAGWALSTDRRQIRYRTVGSAFALQIAIAVLAIKLPVGRDFIRSMAAGYHSLIVASQSGVDLVLGSVSTMPGVGLAFTMLPIIVFFAALASVLNYLRIIPLLVSAVGGVLHKLLAVGRVESLCAAANVFVGQSESPLVIRPYLARLSPSSLFAVMTSGMAGVAGTILAAYAQIGINLDYLLVASFMAAPAGLLMAKLVFPDQVVDETEVVDQADPPSSSNLIMAVSQGAQDGIKVAVSVGAMLLAIVALISVLNALISSGSGALGFGDLTLQGLLGRLFAPLMPLLGIPWSEAQQAGALMGERLILNEFIAFVHLHGQAGSLSPHTVGVLTFALCGFANLGSIGIQMAVIGGLAPQHRLFVSKYGLRALCAATLANAASAAIASFLLP
jgi:CNT family concentrative nucleoside transporter